MVTWRGVSLDDRTAAMMDEVVRLCPGINIDPSQGSWSGAAASAGTHSGCGAIDVTNLSASECDTVVYSMRRVGGAAWHRTPEQSDWPRHVHMISVQPGGKGDRGCLHASAHDQVIDYYENRNGLASNAPDDATRDFVGVTWESYLAGGKDNVWEDEDMFIVEAPNRGAGLFAPGYYISLTLEQRDVLTDLGVRRTNHNDRGYDVARAAMLQGTDSVSAD